MKWGVIKKLISYQELHLFEMWNACSKYLRFFLVNSSVFCSFYPNLYSWKYYMIHINLQLYKQTGCNLMLFWHPHASNNCFAWSIPSLCQSYKGIKTRLWRIFLLSSNFYIVLLWTLLFLWIHYSGKWSYKILYFTIGWWHIHAIKLFLDVLCACF